MRMYREWKRDDIFYKGYIIVTSKKFMSISEHACSTCNFFFRKTIGDIDVEAIDSLNI